MIKVFLIIAAVVLCASAYLGYENKNKFVETRENKDKINKSIKKKVEETDVESTKLGELHTALNTRHTQYDQMVAQKDRNIELKEMEEGKLRTANESKSTLMSEKAGYDQVIADFERQFPDVDGIDGVLAKLEELKIKKVTLEKEQKELEMNVATVTAQVDKDRNTIETFNKRKADRSRGIALNGTEGTITAVNQDWGFVVIGIGSNQGVSADSELIVMRDGDVVGKLTIASIEPRQTVADIRMNTLKEGARILPGDVVIFEKLQN